MNSDKEPKKKRHRAFTIETCRSKNTPLHGIAAPKSIERVDNIKASI